MIGHLNANKKKIDVTTMKPDAHLEGARASVNSLEFAVNGGGIDLQSE
jgi:hypothetical protein